MVKKTLASLFLIIFSIIAAFANGGGVYPESATLGSNSPRFRDIKDVEIISERLFFKPQNASTTIKVEYLLWNKSENDYLDVDYGFPVDFQYDKDRWSSADVVISDVQFWANDTNINILNKSQLIDLGRADNNWYWNSDIELDSIRLFDDEKEYSEFTSQMTAARQWFYTKVSIKSYETLKLTVTYEIDNLRWCDGTPPYGLYFFDGCGFNHLFYDFFPASHWGGGIVRDFYAEIDFSELYYQNALLGDHKERVAGLDFEKKGDKYIYRVRNFDLKNASRLLVKYPSNDISSIDMLAKHLIPQNKYAIEVSTELPTYPKANLSDMNFETIWVSKGVGGQIEVDVSKCNKKVNAIGLVLDYQKNEQTYLENNRVKNLQLDLKYKDKDWLLNVDYDSGRLQPKDYSKIYFGDFINNTLFFDMAIYEFEYFQDGGDWNWEADRILPLEKIRFTIKEVLPGAKYDDTCITEILLFH